MNIQDKITEKQLKFMDHLLGDNQVRAREAAKKFRIDQSDYEFNRMTKKDASAVISFMLGK